MLRPVRVIGLTVTLAAPAHAQYQYPAAPANPTFQDCIDLSQEYHAILSTLYEQHRVCQNQEPQFGRAMRCNGTYGAVPWAQCQDLALTICEANSGGGRAGRPTATGCGVTQRVAIRSVGNRALNEQPWTEPPVFKPRFQVRLLQGPRRQRS